MIVLAGCLMILAIYEWSFSNEYAAGRDFISYWAAGQQLIHRQSPYDFQAVRALELQAGRDPTDAVAMMRNPPVAFFMALPLGLGDPKTTLMFWSTALLGLLFVSCLLIWRINGSPDNRVHLLGLAFAPCIACMSNGQFGIFLLVGVVLFLYFHINRPMLAGACLLLCVLKPHFFGPFGVALVVWAVMTKRAFRMLGGFCVAVAASCALAYALDPDAWKQYSVMMRTGGALSEPIPELSVTLRFLIDPQATWIQFVPVAAACVWAGWYFWSHRAQWDWLDHGMILLLVGAMCTPFGWITDESILLPAVLGGVYRAIRAHRPVWPLAVFWIASVAELFMNVPIKSRFYLWTTPAWLCWYLYATGRIPGRFGSAIASPADGRGPA